MTARQSIASSNAPKAIGPYSQAILAGGWLHCSGQIGLDPATGELVGGGIRAQTERAMANLSAVLEQAGASWAHVVKCNVYLVDMADFGAMNEIYGRAFVQGPAPARATVAVHQLPRGALVEIDCLAQLA